MFGRSLKDPSDAIARRAREYRLPFADWVVPSAQRDIFRDPKIKEAARRLYYRRRGTLTPEDDATSETIVFWSGEEPTPARDEAIERIRIRV